MCVTSFIFLSVKPSWKSCEKKIKQQKIFRQSKNFIHFQTTRIHQNHSHTNAFVQLYGACVLFLMEYLQLSIPQYGIMSSKSYLYAYGNNTFHTVNGFQFVDICACMRVTDDASKKIIATAEERKKNSMKKKKCSANRSHNVI